MARAITVIAGLVVLAGCVSGVLWALSSHSSLMFDPAPASIATATPVSVRIANDHGVRSITARIVQDENSSELDRVARPVTRFGFWRAHARPETYRFLAGKDRAPALKEGKARLIVETQSNDF